MIKQLCLLFLCFLYAQAQSQTTDLSINIEAQNLGGSAVSQVDIYQDFQYLITISNSGNTVSNANISIDFDDDLIINSTTSQNNTNGATDVSGINITGNVLTGIIADLPNNSSVELLVAVTAPTNLGGIAANGTISPPNGTTDTNTSNNQSIISIDVLDIVIDFTVSHLQIQPAEGTAIDAWGDEVTYQFTITNNSAIDFLVDAIEGKLLLESLPENGLPFSEFVSLDCIGSTNGTLCPDLTNLNTFSNTVSATSLITAPSNFIFNEAVEFTSGGSLTFELVYRYSSLACSSNPFPIDVESFIRIALGHSNVSPNVSNGVLTDLLSADPCPETDLCVETIQTNPDLSIDIEYDQEVTFETTICNNGPLEAPVLIFMQNLSPNVDWDIISVNCITTNSSLACDDFTISDNGQLWVTSEFTLQPNTTILIETVVKFIEPPCNPFPNQVEASIKSEIVLVDSQLVDIDPNNNSFFNNIELPLEEPCDIGDSYALQVSKVQTSPELPVGGTPQNTTEWGEVTYEIIITNSGTSDQPIQVQDHMPVPPSSATALNAMLTSVECIGTTGSANCFSINNAYVGVIHDGVTEDGSFDTFWEVLPEDNWILPANSSVTFSVTVDWQPECSTSLIIGENVVRVSHVNDVVETNLSDNIAEVATYFAPCVDLVVQTYPEFTQVETGEALNWIVDISNSITSSTAIDIEFENVLNAAFTISGSPTCTVSSGSATCISNFNINGNTITGIVPVIDAGSTVSISIPVIAPAFGGAFNNVAEAFPSAANNEEVTSETNISINSVQVISPELDKFFLPETIFEGGESELVFTIFNIASNPTQNNIAFIDNLPNGVVLSGIPNWVEANGCTAVFNGNIGDTSVGISDLIFPDGVESCTFSVMVTSDTAGSYLNNFSNFSNTNNIDTSQTSATLNVIIDTSNVDIAITKTVEPFEVIIGDQTTFTITASNFGTSEGTNIEILDVLPQGYEFISAVSSMGGFDESSLIWTIPSLMPNESATLQINVQVVSSINLLNVAALNSLSEIDRDSSNNEDSASVEISNCLQIPEGISPNGDGKNDVLVIPCIEDFPENTIKIYNRYGAQIYQGNNYANTWGGKTNMGFPNSSALLPVGTYFYVLEINALDTSYQGYIYLNY